MKGANDNSPRFDPPRRACGVCAQFHHGGVVIGGNTVGWCRMFGATVWAHGGCPCFTALVPVLMAGEPEP